MSSLQKASATLSTAPTVLYTVPAGVDRAVVLSGTCNNVGSDTTLTVHVVDNGGAIGTGNEYISGKTVQKSAPNPLDSITGMILEEGDYIAAIAGAAGSLNIRLGIMEM